MADRKYWASRRSEDVISELTERRKDYYDHVQREGRVDAWDVSQRLYYGLTNSLGSRETQVGFGGKQGETLLISDNEYRSLTDTFHTLVTGERLGITAMAQNPSSEAMASAKLADAVIDFFSEREGLEEVQGEAARIAIHAGEAHQLHRWDPHLGRLMMLEPVLDPKGKPIQEEVGIDPMGNPVMGEPRQPPLLDDDGKPITRPVYEGDVSIKALHPIDVVRDPIAKESGWREVRMFMNRYDLAALYPEQRDAILSSDSAADSSEMLWRSQLLTRQGQSYRSDDLVLARLFLHEQSPSMPKGREMLHCGDKALFDRFLTKDPTRQVEIPLRCLPFELEFNSPFGSSRAWDLLSLQEALNATLSTILTNSDASGQRILWVGHDGGLEPSDLSGLVLVKSAEAPSPMNFGGMNAEQLQLVDVLVSTMTRLMGLNSVARGEPSAEMSGTAYALLHSMALQAAAGFQRHYSHLVEWNANQLISLLKRNVKEQRFVDIAGKGNSSKIKAFVGTDLEAVHRVKVDIGSALSRSMQGRLQLTEMFMQNNFIKSREEAIQMLTTGDVDQATHGPVANEIQARSENEYMEEFAASPEGQQWFMGYQQAMQLQQQFAEAQAAYQMQVQQAAAMGQVLQIQAPIPPPPPPPLPDGLRPVAFELHHVHVPCHAAAIADPNSKSNPVLMAVHSAHEAEHVQIVDQLTKTNPIALQLAAGVAPQAIQAPPAPPGPLPGMGGPQEVAKGTNVPGVSDNGMSPAGKLPDMPTNPATGEPAQVPQGMPF